MSDEVNSLLNFDALLSFVESLSEHAVACPECGWSAGTTVKQMLDQGRVRIVWHDDEVADEPDHCSKCGQPLRITLKWE